MRTSLTLIAALLITAPLPADEIPVRAGESVQLALDRATCGDHVILQAGARFVGALRVPVKACDGVITVRSSASLPARRLTPADASLLPTLASGSTDAALTATGVSNWRFDGLQFEANANGHSSVVVLQDVTNVTMDRLLFIAPPTGQRRFILGNGRQITLTRSHCAGVWAPGADSQCFLAFDGAGPYAITDNFLEAASENVMFGGADSQSAERIPADILVAGNHFFKRPEWRGVPRQVKNLFELKAAKRVKVIGNLMEGCWPDGQDGTAIQVTVRNQDGRAPWSVIEDVLFEGNTIRDAAHGISILGYDYNQPSGQTTRVTFRNNLFDVRGKFLSISGEAGVLVFDHNTSANAKDHWFAFGSASGGAVWKAGTDAKQTTTIAAESLMFTNHLGMNGEYGFRGDNAPLASFFKTLVWSHVVLGIEGDVHGAKPEWYPGLTFMPPAVDVRAHWTPDFRLLEASPFKGKGSDGKDIGWSGTAPPPTEPPVTPPPVIPPPVTPPVPPPVTPPVEPPPLEPDTTDPTILSMTVTRVSGANYKSVVTAEDNLVVARVAYYLNGVYAGSFSAPTSGMSTYAMPLKIGGKGQFVVRAVVTDGAGNSKASEKTVTR